MGRGEGTGRALPQCVLSVPGFLSFHEARGRALRVGERRAAWARLGLLPSAGALVCAHSLFPFLSVGPVCPVVPQPQEPV